MSESLSAQIIEEIGTVLGNMSIDNGYAFDVGAVAYDDITIERDNSDFPLHQIVVSEIPSTVDTTSQTQEIKLQVKINSYVQMYLYKFTVEGATVSPTQDAIYTNNSTTFIVKYVDITDGDGDVYCYRSSESGEPEASGELTKVSGTGDAAIDYTAVAEVRHDSLQFRKLQMEFATDIRVALLTSYTRQQAGTFVMPEFLNINDFSQALFINQAIKNIAGVQTIASYNFDILFTGR